MSFPTFVTGKRAVLTVTLAFTTTFRLAVAVLP